MIVSKRRRNFTSSYYHIGITYHGGVNEMKRSLSLRYYWPKINEEIEQFVNNSETCEKNKYDHGAPVIKFNLTPTASKRF